MSTFIELDSKYRDRMQYANPADFSVSAGQTAGWSNLIRNTQCVKPCEKKEACNLLFCVKLLKLTVPNRLVAADGSTTEFIARDPYNQPVSTDNINLYVHLSTNRYDDGNLIRTIDNRHRDATFVAVPERNAQGFPHFAYQAPPNQNNINIAAPDRNLEEWIVMRSDMVQCIRLEDKKPVLRLRIFTNQEQSVDGNFVPVIGGPLAGFSNSSNSVRIYGDDINTSLTPVPTRQVRALFEITPLARDNDFSNHLVSLWNDN